MTKLLAIFRCCRDWPVLPIAPIGRCGLCGERPTYAGKSIEQYMAERKGSNRAH